jgi:molybdenum cofactor cytidylyltransferase
MLLSIQSNQQMDNYAFLILAAGNSSRLGKPKQLLEYKGKPLLQHTIDIAREVNQGLVFTVVGANSDLVQEKINFHDSYVFIHSRWEEGMGSSISFGISSLVKMFSYVKGAVLMVCDQPFISAELLHNLIEAHEEERRNIIASGYSHTLGTPVFFHKSHFKELMQLKGQEGAKKIIYKHEPEVSVVSFPEGAIDIDTVEDYERLQTG